MNIVILLNNLEANLKSIHEDCIECVICKRAFRHAINIIEEIQKATTH